MITNVPVRDVREANPVNVASSPSGRFITLRNEFACELVPVLASAEHGCAVGTKLYTFHFNDVREANPVNVASSPSGRFITLRNEFACELVPVLASAEHGCAVGTKLYTFR